MVAYTTKSGSKSERAALRQRLLDSGATGDDIAAEMRSRWGFRPREAYRHAYGWSQDEVAVRFCGIAGRLGSGVRTPTTMVGTRIGEYERWPHGGRRPSPYVLTVLAEVYGTTLARLVDTVDLVQMPEQERAVLAALGEGRPDRGGKAVQTAAPGGQLVRTGPAPVAVSGRLSVETERLARIDPVAPAVVLPVLLGDEGVARSKEQRRAATLDRTARSGGAGALLVASAFESAEFGEWAEAVRVGPSTLEQLEQDVRVLAHDYLTQPPLPLVRRVLHLRNRVFGMLERRQRPAQARDLYLLAGRLCGLAAWAAGDLGFPAEAGTHARTGWLCADLADADGLRGWLRATQSKLAYWEGRSADSAELAEDGLRYGVRDSGRAGLAGLAARGWARCGQPAKAHRALRLVDIERSALSTPDEVGGILGFSEAQQAYLAGTTYLWLKEPRRALEAADRAVWLFELSEPRQRFYGAESIAQVDSAIALVELGQLDGAAERLRSLLELPPAKRVDVITQRVDDLERLLRRTGPSQVSSAGRLADELAEFRRAG